MIPAKRPTPKTPREIRQPSPEEFMSDVIHEIPATKSISMKNAGGPEPMDEDNDVGDGSDEDDDGEEYVEAETVIVMTLQANLTRAHSDTWWKTSWTIGSTRRCALGMLIRSILSRLIRYIRECVAIWSSGRAGTGSRT